MEIEGDLGNTESNLWDKRKEFMRFCFTLNNWTEEEHSTLVSYGKNKCKFFVIGKEIGKECGTPHLQGYMETKKKVRFTSVKKVNGRMNFRPCKGSKEDNVDYCTKDGDFIMTEKPLTLKEQLKKEFLDRYEGVEWKPWQLEVLDLVEKEDDRTINWFYETVGNVGKSFVCNYLCAKYDIIICDGKKDNIFNQVNTMIESGKRPKGIIMDIPRTSYDYVNYGVLETLKNGVCYSGKYEGGQLFLPKMFVICFANERPCENAMSKDRWNIVEIKHQ